MSSHTANQSTAEAEAVAQRISDKADEAIASTRRAADQALDTVQDKASQLASMAPSAFSRVAAQVDELTRRGLERARHTRDDLQERAHRGGDRAVGYIKDEPIKSVLIAAATGAAVAALVTLLVRNGRD